MTNSNSNTGRREFMQKSVIGTAAAGLAVTSTSHVTAQTVPDAAEPEVTNSHVEQLQQSMVKSVRPDS